MAQPSLQQLRYLVAIADHGTFGAAADAEYVSQPALSAQIKELEKRLGSVLLERSNKGTILTASGDEVVRRARDIIRQVDELVEAAAHDGRSLRGTIRLGAIPTVAPYLLPATVRSIMALHPDIRLLLHEAKTPDLLEQLRNGEIDLAMLARPVIGDDLVVMDLGVDPFLLALPSAHPLAKRRGAVSISTLDDDRVLLLDEGHCLRDQTVEVCRMLQTEPEDVQATSLSALVQMVAAGLGVTLLPKCASAIEAREGSGIVTKKFSDSTPHRTLVMAWRRSSPNSPVYAELARAVAKAAALG